VTEPSVSGFLLIDKPSGVTSHTVVAQVRKALGTRRVGHGGTLDPMATGLLIIGVGRATRLLGYIAGHTKQYVATIRLGAGTTTDDAEGELLGKWVLSTSLSTDEISEVVSSYLGKIQQVPSAVSAIKVDGKRSYARVRAGESVELSPREVTIDQFSLTHRVDGSPWVDIDVVVDCSSGTYIRALARDLGRDLGVGGHLTALRRTRIGDLSVDQARTIEGISSRSLISMGEMAPHIAPVVEVDDDQVRDISVGRRLPITLATKLASMMYDHDLVALYEPDETVSGCARPVAVFIDSPPSLSLQGDEEKESTHSQPSVILRSAPARLAESRLDSPTTVESGPCEQVFLASLVTQPQGDGIGASGDVRSRGEAHDG